MFKSETVCLMYSFRMRTSVLAIVMSSRVTLNGLFRIIFVMSKCLYSLIEQFCTTDK